jgi:alpha-L-fucosidase 2
MDAGMGVTAAILDMLLHARRGVNHLFAGAPPGWERVAFEGMLTEGAFLVSAARVRGRVTQVKVRGQTNGTFRLANPWRGPATVLYPSGQKETTDGDVLEIPVQAGQTITILPPGGLSQG